jgi:antitoxin YefM
MTTVTFTDLRQNLAEYLDKAEQDCEEIVITRSKGRSAILLSLDDFLSMQETAHLLSSKANRKHLEKSLQEVESGTIKRFRP